MKNCLTSSPFPPLIACPPSAGYGLSATDAVASARCQALEDRLPAQLISIIEARGSGLGFDPTIVARLVARTWSGAPSQGPADDQSTSQTNEPTQDVQKYFVPPSVPNKEASQRPENSVYSYHQPPLSPFPLLLLSFSTIVFVI